MSKNDYGSDWWYSTDFIFSGNYQRRTMKVVGYHPPGTVKTEQGDNVKEPVLDLECKGKVKKLSINVSNKALGTRFIGEQLGEKWVGHELICEVRMIEHKGEPKAAIRIVPKGRELDGFEEARWFGAKADLTKRFEIGKYKGVKCVVVAGDLE